MNQDQFLSWLRTTLGIAGGLAVQYGVTNASTATAITGAVVAVAPFVWGFFSHTDVAKLQAAGSIPGIRPIEVTPSASLNLQQLAKDPNVRTVIEAPAYVPQRGEL